MLKRKASRTKFFLETPDSLRRKFAKNQGDQATHSGSSSLTVPVANAMPQSANEQPSNPAFQQLPAQLPPNPNPITYFPSFQSLLAADLSPSFLQFLAQEPIMQAYSETINTSLPAVTPNQTTNLINYPNGHVGCLPNDGTNFFQTSNFSFPPHNSYQHFSAIETQQSDLNFYRREETTKNNMSPESMARILSLDPSARAQFLVNLSMRPGQSLAALMPQNLSENLTVSSQVSTNMPLNEPALRTKIAKKRLKPADISIEEIKSKLNELSYSNEEITKLLSKQTSLAAVQSLIELHSSLIGNFTRALLIRVATNCSGSINLLAIKENYQALKDLEFTAEQIVSIVAHAGGSNNLESLKENYVELRNMGFTVEQISAIAAHRGGSKNLVSIKPNFGALKDLGFSADQIITIAANVGGSKNLFAVKENYEALKNLGFSFDQILKMVAPGGGSKNLFAVKENYNFLIELGFTPTEIFKIVARNSGSRNLVSLKENYNTLKGFGFTHERIVRMVSHNDGFKNLAAVKENYDVLKGLGFTHEQMVRTVAYDNGHNNGLKNLLAVKTSYDALKTKGYSEDEILRYAGLKEIPEERDIFKNSDQLDITAFRHPSRKDTIVFYFEEGCIKELPLINEVLAKYPHLDAAKINRIRAGMFAKNLNQQRTAMLKVLPQEEFNSTKKIEVKGSFVIIPHFAALCELLYDEKVAAWMKESRAEDAASYPELPEYIKNELAKYEGLNQSISSTQNNAFIELEHLIELSLDQDIQHSEHEDDEERTSFVNEFLDELALPDFSHFPSPSDETFENMDDFFLGEFPDLASKNPHVVTNKYSFWNQNSNQIHDARQNSKRNSNDTVHSHNTRKLS